MIHPDSERVFVNEQIGVGVSATRSIPLGTIVWARDRFDLTFTDAEQRRMSEADRALVDHYGYQDPDGDWIMCWDDGRLVNHSCEPAMRGVGPWLQIAVRDIAPGEPITCDYAECNLDPPLACLCGAPGCRGEVGGRDLLTFADVWDGEVRAAVARARDVAQPLWPYLLEPDWVRAVFAGDEPVPSLRTIYFAR